MKIVHITSNYIEGWGYQENLLPLYQQRAGHDVVVISDNEHLRYAQNPSLAQKIISQGMEYEKDGIKIYKIKTYLNTSSTSFICNGVFRLLKKEHPEIIFHHDLNTSTLSAAAKYKKYHTEVKLYVDNHADWINESKNRLWHRLFYDTVIPLQVKRLGNTVNYYIGVSPLRCQYLKKVFKVPEDKIRFLPIGCDTYLAEQVFESREELKNKYNVPLDAFVVVSGGKIDRSKGTLSLIEACCDLVKKGEKIHLVLFGKIDDEVKNAASQFTWITTLGWCDRISTLSLLKMADLACWPWLHTTLIEDSVASGTPLVVKMSENVSHFSHEKAGFFLECGDKDELVKALIDVKNNIESYRRNIQNARDKFSYATIVKRLDKEDFYELL